MDALQLTLTKAFAQRNIEDFKVALFKGGNPKELDDKNQCIYEKCLATPESAEYIKACLKFGCTVDYINPKLNKSAINYAADSRCSDNLKVLLDRSDILKDHPYAGLTPLNSLAKNLDFKNLCEVTRCMKELLDHGASPNIPDKNGKVPLHHVLIKDNQRNFQPLVELLLKQTDLDINSCSNLRQLLMDKYPDLPLPAQNMKSSTTLEQLIALLQNREEQKFEQLLPRYKGTKGGDELIRICLESGLSQSFDLLLKSNLLIDVNITYVEKSLVELAIINGNWYALDLLLKHPELELHPKMQLLNRVISKLDEPLAQPNYCDYKKCFDILLENEKVRVNEIDDCGYTPLHYATRYQQDEAIKKLLAKGAWLAQTSKFNEMPVEDIDAELLEEHFNECISYNGASRAAKELEVVIDFKNLGSNQGLNLLEYLAQSEHLRHLLKHPLVASFLLLKWQTVKRPFAIHFVLNVLITIAIVLHAVFRFTELGNPYMTSFMTAAVFLGCAYMGIIEVIQLNYRRKSYFSIPSSLFNSVLSWVIIILCLLASLELGLGLYAERTMAVYAIFLAAIKLTLLLGSLPWSSVSTHMLMFSGVFWTYLKSLFFFIIIILAFSVSFYILLPKDVKGEIDDTAPPTGPSQTSPKNKTEYFHTFSNISSVFIKTIIIATGEYNTGEYPFANTFDYIFFGIFVITVTLVIFNLMSGLAFGDTQEIRAQAKINGSICRIRLLRHFEIFLEQPHNCWERFLSIILKPLLGQSLSVTKLSIKPNQRNVMEAELETIYSKDIERHPNSKPKTIKLYNFVVDKKIVNRARAILRQKV